MAEVEQVEVHSASHLRNMARVNRDEQELRELMKQAGMVQEDETQEEATDSESDSESSEDTSVQAESVSEQKEKKPTKAKAQEEDDTELTAEEKTFKQRYGDLRRHMQEKEKEVAAKLEKLEKQLELATKNELVLPKSNDEIEAWAKKYPDVAGIVEAIATKKADEKAASLDTRLKEIEELRVDAKRQRAEAELLQMHPDFEQLRQDDAFHNWAEEQPKWVQDALYENAEDAKSVSRVIDLYKADNGIKAARSTSSDKGAASSVRTKRSTQIQEDDASTYLSESQVAKMSIKEYEKRQKEILDAQRSGKFIYDMTK